MRGIKCCLNCTDRKLACHATCERYIQEKTACDAEREKAKEAKRKLIDCEAVQIRSVCNMKGIKPRYF